MRSVSHDDFMVEHYRTNPDYAAQVLNALLEDGDGTEWRVISSQLSRAFGTDEKTGAEEEAVTVAMLTALVKAMGMRLVVAPIAATPCMEESTPEQAVA